MLGAIPITTISASAAPGEGHPLDSAFHLMHVGIPVSSKSVSTKPEAEKTVALMEKSPLPWQSVRSLPYSERWQTLAW